MDKKIKCPKCGSIDISAVSADDSGVLFFCESCCYTGDDFPCPCCGGQLVNSDADEK